MEEEGTEGERNTSEDDAGGSQTDGSQSRKQNRKPTKIGTIRQEFIAVTSVGIPTEPKRHSEGYDRQIAAILWNTVPITTINPRSRDNIHYCQLLIDKLHTRYKFPDPYNNTNLKGNKVIKRAFRKMSKSLSNLCEDGNFGEEPNLGGAQGERASNRRTYLRPFQGQV